MIDTLEYAQGRSQGYKFDLLPIELNSLIILAQTLVRNAKAVEDELCSTFSASALASQEQRTSSLVCL